MTPRIRLQKHNVADLLCIRELGQDRLRRVASEVNKLSLSLIQPEELQSVICKALDGDEENADVVLRQLLSLHGMLRQMDISPDEAFDGLAIGLRWADWSDADLEKWDSISSALKELFEAPIVRLTAKALDLSYLHTHLLRSARIITDMRPLFSDDATEIHGTVIAHKLLLRYDDIEGEHVISVAVDERDISSLIEQCQRALTKSKTAQITLKEKAGLKSLAHGKD
jgi:hypothetical protein